MREIKLNIDSKVILEKTEKNQRVIIINPEALKNTSATEPWDEISGVFGRYDFDMWLAKVIVAKAMNAAAYGGKSADLTDICGAVLYIQMNRTGKCLRTTKHLCFCLEILRFSKL